MHATEHSVRLERISQERFIQAPIEVIYDYVTQPDRWHEWHPTSLSADRSEERRVGKECPV